MYIHCLNCTFIACCQTQSSYIYHKHLNPRFCRLSDERNAFCLNGLEIDLDELDALEQRVKAKKRLQEAPDDASGSNNTCSSKPPADDVDEVDELDEYLKELKLRESREQEQQQQLQRQQTNYNNDISYSDSIQSTHFAILLYWFLAILNLANATYCKHCELDNA